MPNKNYILIENFSTESTDLDKYSYSDKKIGSGYYRKGDGLHTVEISLDNFKGSIKLQGTLDLYPGENSWSDLRFVTGNDLESVDSSNITANLTRNFKGNWIWVRSAHVLEQGTIQSIRYTF